ncbi:cytochrome P450 [Patulibacter defluvii]|uniref:cytochrome P450 n=1 Tax=Patulibacter defluvii TaxID=3095358 RepID=UPI002A757AA0|nr:cytochrome P450 [Patulibacter sp. DM4]
MRRRHQPPRGSDAPVLDLDLYDRRALADPDGTYAAIRDAGPAVWLPRHRIFAIGRYADVRAALKDSETFASGDGVAANPLANRLGRRTTISADGDVHATRRGVLLRSVGAKSLAHLREQVQREAEQVVEELLTGGAFDGVEDFASALPLRVVADLVGVRVPHERLLAWGRATFDGLGPVNGRGLRAAGAALDLWRYARRLRREMVVPGGWAESVFDAADAGEISQREARTMVIDFVAPSLDTTILASAALLRDLATVDGLWPRLREQPDRIPAAVVESVRLSSPIRGFTRRVARPAVVDGTTLPVGSRVAVLYAAANHDERQFAEPRRFDLDRRPAANFGWGNGPHTCVGIHLAKLEMQALLHAMVPRVASVETGQPTWLHNNTLQGIERLPARLHSLDPERREG